MKLHYDFLGFSYCFENAYKIIQTYQLDDVLNCLYEVEEWVKRGYYAAGFVSYEAASAFQSYLVTHPIGRMPLIWFGIFKEPVSEKKIKDSEKIGFESLDWQADCSWSEYQHAIAVIKHYISMGDTYQVNYTLRMKSQFRGDSYKFYFHMLQAQRSNYSAYLDIGSFKILSVSPELFFKIQNRHITTKPMKGTAPRGLTLEGDYQKYEFLKNEKNCAENLMIVDLLRNDLGKIAQQGTVRVSSLFDEEKYPTVWQLTSEITARLKEKTTYSDVLKALFPCGSITGAPKINTMKIIRQLEKQPREIYCGALGMITPQQEAIFSVPIRTMIINGDQAVYGVGGGITWDSTSQDEYQEVIHKIQVLYDCKIPEHLFESILLEEGDYFLLPLHIKRLKESSEYFDFNFVSSRLMEQLKDLADHNPKGRWKVRILLDQKGNIESEIHRIQPLHLDLTATWACNPVKSENVFLYHKTTTRDCYPSVSLNNEYLLFNEKDEVTEFVNGNMLLFKDGCWITPPIASGLLKGTMRQYLISQGIVTEQVIRKTDINASSQIAFINSVCKWRKLIWDG